MFCLVTMVDVVTLLSMFTHCILLCKRIFVFTEKFLNWRSIRTRLAFFDEHSTSIRRAFDEHSMPFDAIWRHLTPFDAIRRLLTPFDAIWRHSTTPGSLCDATFDVTSTPLSTSLRSHFYNDDDDVTFVCDRRQCSIGGCKQSSRQQLGSVVENSVWVNTRRIFGFTRVEAEPGLSVLWIYDGPAKSIPTCGNGGDSVVLKSGDGAIFCAMCFLPFTNFSYWWHLIK